MSDLGLGSAVSSLSASATPAAATGSLQKGAGTAEGKPGAGPVRLNSSKASGDGSGNGTGSGVAGTLASSGRADRNARGTGTALVGKATGNASGGEIRDSHGAGQGGSDSASAGGRGKGDSGKGGGSRGDVDRRMSQAKGKLQALYKRALDDDPTMEGSVTVRLKIAPSGQVLEATIVNSDLHNPALEAKILSVIRSLDFESGSFEVWSDTYKFNFMPSG